VAVLSVAQQRSPLARRPYDLRHAAASLWLNSGVAPTEVACRLGHSVAILLKVYPNCLDTDEEVANERIAFGWRACSALANWAVPRTTVSGHHPWSADQTRTRTAQMILVHGKAAGRRARIVA
jgi:hypothetical protein